MGDVQFDRYPSCLSHLVDVDGSGSVNGDSLLCVHCTTPGILATGLEPNALSKIWTTFDSIVCFCILVCFF